MHAPLPNADPRDANLHDSHLHDAGLQNAGLPNAGLQNAGLQDAGLRDAYLLDPDTVFLNHGSFGACPAEVLDALHAWQRQMERNPVQFFLQSGALLATARAQLAAYLGASADDLVFVPNATTGVNTVLHSLALAPGDEVITTDHEYGACAMALRRVCDAAGATVRTVTVPLPYDADTWTQRLLDAATPRTRLVFASHITSVTALVFPVAQLCSQARACGITTLIDGAHAPGHLPLQLDAIGADFYSGNCHKWLSAPKGAAFLHARRERQAELHAPVVSWGYVAEEMAEKMAKEMAEKMTDGMADNRAADSARGTAEAAADDTADTRFTSSPTPFDSYTGRTRFQRRLQWQGTRDIAPALAVPAAIAFQQRHDWPRWQQHCHALACQTQQRVLARNCLRPVAPDAAYGQMLTIPIRLAGDGAAAAALQRWLYTQHRIEIPITQHAGHSFARVSVQPYNSSADLDALVAALAEAGV